MELTVEIHFAQELAANQVKIREKALKKIEKWLHKTPISSDGLNEEGLLKLWKGLFYYFWHCDKPLFQEDRAQRLGKYIHVFESVEGSFLYIDTFFQTMAREWFTIDHYRLEKFMMLVRKFLHECYELLKLQNWDVTITHQLIKILKKTVLGVPDQTAPSGLKMHVAEIYMEELSKVGSDELSAEAVQQFLIPYCRILSRCGDSSFVSTVKKEVFLYLIHQEVDEKEFHEFPILKFDADEVQKLLMEQAKKPDIRRKNIKVIYDAVKKYDDFKIGVNVEDIIWKDASKGRKLRKRAIDRAALSLLEEDEEIMRDRKEFQKKKKKKIADNIIDL